MTNQENQNTLKSWATGRVAKLVIGFLAGYALWHFGVIQKVTSKLFSKKEE